MPAEREFAYYNLKSNRQNYNFTYVCRDILGSKFGPGRRNILNRMATGVARIYSAAVFFVAGAYLGLGRLGSCLGR